MDATFVWKLGKLGRLGSNRLRYDDDFVDRLNYQFSGVILFLFIGLVSIRQYMGKPIQCWIPQEFTRGWEEYAENYCWIANTYFATIRGQLPHKINRKERMIGYYQWAPIFMALQALMFYLPCLIWRGFNHRSGFNIRRLIQMASSDPNIILSNFNCEYKPGPSSNTACRFMGRYISNCILRRQYRSRSLLKSSHSYKKGESENILFPISDSCCSRCCANRGCLQSCCGRQNGNYLIALYISVKFLYLINVIFQLYIMELFIGTSYSFYGIRLLIDLIRGQHWYNSGHFPRVTFCDLEAKKLGKNNLYTLQCVLPMNMFLEKIFIFLWFWHVLLGIINFMSILSWSSQILSLKRRIRFIRKQLRISGVLKDTDLSASRQFVLQYLKPDVVFLLKLIGSNIGEIIVTDLTTELWYIYRHKKLNESEDLKNTALILTSSLDSDMKLPRNMVGNNTMSNNPMDKTSMNNNHDDIV